MWPIRESQLATVIIGSVALVFFLGVTLYSYRQGTSGRRYVPGLLLIMVASFNTVVRGLFLFVVVVLQAKLSKRAQA